MRYSPSALGLYQACPRAYEFRYIVNAPAVSSFTPLPLKKGSIVHRILELSATKTEQEVMTIVVAEFKEYDLVKELFEELKRTTLVDGFYRDLFCTERKIFFKHNEIEFMGIIDRINKTGEKDYEVIDYKYGKNEHTNFNSLQPQIYAWAMFSNFGFDINLRFSYYNIQQRTKVSRAYKPEEIDINAIAELAIQSQTQFPAKPEFTCLWCSYRTMCKDGKDFLTSEIELDGEDISRVGRRLLDVRTRQSIYNQKRKKYEEVLKMYFDYSGETELKIDKQIIRYDHDSKKLVV